MTTRKCVFCDGEASLEDADISPGQQTSLTFCCKKCDRSFSEIFEYSRTENAAGEEVDDAYY